MFFFSTLRSRFRAMLYCTRGSLFRRSFELQRERETEIPKRSQKLYRRAYFTRLFSFMRLRVYIYAL